jgi:hypothetical protein
MFKDIVTSCINVKCHDAKSYFDACSSCREKMLEGLRSLGYRVKAV